MGKGKALIGGTEQSEGIVYPSDWPCFCGHLKKDHQGGNGLQTSACIVAGNGWEAWADRCMDYTPIDNLSYVEMKAHGKISI